MVRHAVSLRIYICHELTTCDASQAVLGGPCGRAERVDCGVSGCGVCPAAVRLVVSNAVLCLVLYPIRPVHQRRPLLFLPDLLPRRPAPAVPIPS
jgi:hypothetical protein